jgi:hypothetical protein
MRAGHGLDDLVIPGSRPRKKKERKRKKGFTFYLSVSINASQGCPAGISAGAKFEHEVAWRDRSIEQMDGSMKWFAFTSWKVYLKTPW